MNRFEREHEERRAREINEANHVPRQGLSNNRKLVSRHSEEYHPRSVWSYSERRLVNYEEL